MRREELVRRVGEGWAALREVLAHLDDRRLLRPVHDDWSGADLLAHLEVWHRVLRSRITGEGDPETRSLARGEYSPDDIDRVNEVLRARSAGWSLADLRAGLERSLEELLPAIEAADEELLARPWHPHDPGRGTLAENIAADTFEHYEEHLPALRALGEGQAERG